MLHPDITLLIRAHTGLPWNRGYHEKYADGKYTDVVKRNRTELLMLATRYRGLERRAARAAIHEIFRRDRHQVVMAGGGTGLAPRSIRRQAFLEHRRDAKRRAKLDAATLAAAAR